MGIVKIKVKHIIMSTAVFLIAFYILIPAGFFMYGRYMEGRNSEKAGKAYRRYVDIFSRGIGRDEALYKTAHSIFPDGSTLMKVLPSAVGGGQYVDKSMADEAEKYYRQIITEYKSSSFYSRAYDSLCYLYSVTGETEKAQTLIDEGIGSGNPKVRFITSKYKMIYLLLEDKINDVIAIGEKLKKDNVDDRELYFIMGEAYFSAGDFNRAIDCYSKGAGILQHYPQNEDNGIRELYFASDYSPDFKLKYINMVKSGSGKNNKIEGKILAGNKPVPFAYVYLKNEKDGGLNSIGGESYNIYAVTDFNGEYSISNIPEGNYILGAGVSSFYTADLVYVRPEFGVFHLKQGEAVNYDFNFVEPFKITKGSGTVTPLDGSIDLEWDAVRGAAYYIINCVEFETPGKISGNTISFSISDKITDNKYLIDTEEVNSREKGYLCSDKGVVNPQAYLGVFYPGCSVPIYVEAFDKLGKRLNSTVPMRVEYEKTTIVKISGEGLSEGDSLLLQNKPEEAAESYDKQLMKEPENIRVLNVLSRIFKIGTNVKPDEDGEIEGRNLDRAIELNERLFKLTGNYIYKKRIAEIYYIDKKDYKKSIEEYGSVPEDHMGVSNYTSLARQELMLLNFKKADEYYKKIYNICKDTSYNQMTPVLLKLYEGDFDEALKFLEIMDMSIYNVDKDRVKYNIEKISGLNKENSDYEKFRKALRLELTYNNGELFSKDFLSIRDSVNDPVLYEFLNQIAYYEYLFY